MSRAALAAYFHNLREKQNLSHYRIYCRGCVLHQKKLPQDAGTYNNADWQAEGDCFINETGCQISESGPRMGGGTLAALMEALAEAEEDVQLDDGAMEGSGDEYRP
ncbi:hypothetical protein B0H14DRAFT_2613203 [Mycena olivaceomarginata]|nr:hypothetical protein B0H14DRAFT_2613203 [Mycena olivaceomarginata]